MIQDFLFDDEHCNDAPTGVSRLYDLYHEPSLEEIYTGEPSSSQESIATMLDSLMSLNNQTITTISRMLNLAMCPGYFEDEFEEFVFHNDLHITGCFANGVFTWVEPKINFFPRPFG